ncbi:MFS transporter [Paraburkholderia dipogonis]|uniref:MFS transporter n=1 Tax=Paraburkholderia dipogonis TaxID=1211383 RepID=UPI001FCC1491|nr:MFS transporter [Paraburkholderia dipogonis]
MLWGLCTVAQMFVSGAASLYFARFLLGAAEAGFFPGLMLYLSYWIPDAARARVNSILLLAMPIAGITGSPLSGWIVSQMRGSWVFMDGSGCSCSRVCRQVYSECSRRS